MGIGLEAYFRYLNVAKTGLSHRGQSWGDGSTNPTTSKMELFANNSRKNHYVRLSRTDW